MRALIPEFNRVILELAPRYDARPLAPASLADLMRLDLERAPLPVWEGASDATIYGDARVNHAFRAWHDAAHIAGAHAFTLEGEADTCAAQKRDVLAAYPRAPMSWLALLDAEIIGQAAHYARTGEFVTDQNAFMRDALRGFL